MVSKALLILCAQAFLAQVISAQCLGNVLNTGAIGIGNGLGLAGNGLVAGHGAGLGLAVNGIGMAGNGVAANSNGGGLTVTSASPIAPTGLAVVSDYVIEGPVAVAGELPFLSAVAVDGQVPAGGQAGASYACGSGNVGIVSEGLGAGAGLAGGYGAGLAGGRGVGAGRGLAGGLAYGSAVNGLGTGIGLGGRGCGAVF